MVDITALHQLVLTSLEDGKAQNIISINVGNLTSITDIMIFCSGTSSRHVKSLAENVIVKVKQSGKKVFGQEGEKEGEWVLVDLGDIILHIMQPNIREYYQLEKLWDIKEASVSKT